MTADEFEAVAKMAIGGMLSVSFAAGETLRIGRDKSVTYDYGNDQKHHYPRDVIIGISRVGSQVLISTRQEIAHVDPSLVVGVVVAGHPDLTMLDELRKPMPGMYL